MVLPPTEIFNWRVGSIWIGKILMLCLYDCCFNIEVSFLSDIQTVGCMADRASTISRMCEVIKNYLQNCSITTLSLILSEWKLIFSRSNFELGSSGDPEDMCDIDPDTLAVVDKICGTAESLECVLGDIINIKLQEDLSKTYCITALDSLRSICRKLEHLSSDTLPEGAVISTTCPLRLDDLLACFADDFYESICSTIVEVVAISRPRDLSGVATLSDSCCGLGNSLINVNSRKM